MNLLLDTHAFLWFAWQDLQLSTTADALITDKSNRIFVSTATWWEIAIKISIGKLTVGQPFDKFISREMTNNEFIHLAIQLNHADQYSQLPLHHRDPFDRMIIAQAIVEGYEIVSADAAFDAYPVRRLW